MRDCSQGMLGRRRSFWTVQPCSTGRDKCGNYCDGFGMVPNESVEGASFSTQDWIESLVYMILLTDGPALDSKCGFRPGARGGHWSDAYRDQPGYTGSHLRQLSTHGSTRDALTELISLARMDMEKLIGYGVALSVDVSAKYLGGNRAQLMIQVIGQDGQSHNVGVIGTRLKNAWMWNQ